MYINTYNLTGQALLGAYEANLIQYELDQAARYHNLPHRVALRRLIAYLAVRRGPDWLDVDIDMLEGYLPTGWGRMPHHELIAAIDAEDIGPWLGNSAL